MCKEKHNFNLIKMTYDELDNIIQYLDLYSRIYIGQYNEIFFYINHRYVWDNKTLHEMFYNLRKIFIPTLPRSMNTSLGIWSLETPLNAKRAYDIQQCLRYQLAHYRSNGKSGYTVNFFAPYIHGKWEMDIEKIKEYHTHLENEGIYPEYIRGYVKKYKWTCPVIIKNFLQKDVEIEANEEVLYFIDMVKKMIDAVNKKDLVTVFNLLYPDVDVNIYKDIAERISQFDCSKI